MEAESRILLTYTSKLFFAADVWYNKCCFHNFRFPWWTSNQSINHESEQNNSNDYALLYELVEYHITDKQDTYAMSQRCSFYHGITNTKIRSVD